MRDDDAQFFEEVIAPLRERMMNTVWRVTQHPGASEDSLQNALARLWKRIRYVRRHPNPEALALRFCFFAAHDELRRMLRDRARLASLHDLEHDPPAHNPDTQGMHDELEGIREALAQIPKRQATAFMMHVVEEQPYRVIADTLGCKEATARTHVKRARLKLRKCLAHLWTEAESKQP